MTLSKLETHRACVLVVDLQEKLAPAMCEPAGCLRSAEKLISAADILGIPVIATEQYPAGLGPTCESIRVALKGAKCHEKLVFSACIDPVMIQLRTAHRSQVIVVGIEAHVCVQQTVLDLLRNGLEVWVCADAVSSRKPADRDFALERMRQAGGAITTVESVIFELLSRAGTEEFKKVLKIVK